MKRFQSSTAKSSSSGCQLRGRRDRDAATLADLYAPIRRLLGSQPIKGAEILAATADSPKALEVHMTLAIDVLRDLEHGRGVRPR